MRVSRFVFVAMLASLAIGLGGGRAAAGELLGNPSPGSPVPRACEPGGVWIVSARAAAQGPGECGCLKVYHQSECGRLCPSDWEGLVAGMDPTAPTLVYVHGSFITFDFFRRDSVVTDNWFRSGLCGRACNRIYFTWPSDGARAVLAGAVRRQERQAAYNGHHVLETISRLPSSSKVTLVGHSHGTETISATLHLLGGGCVGGQRARYSARCPRTVLAAAAMDRRDFRPGHEFDRALRATPSMLVLVSRHDAALIAYPLRRPFSGPALGHAGLSRKSRRKIGPDAARVTHLDVTRSLGVRHVWQSYRQNPSIGRTIANWATR